MTPDRPSPPLRLLHLEDDQHDAALTHALVREEWPGCEIQLADSREAFLVNLARDHFDLILSDFTLPAFNGLTALDFARQADASVPFLFLSGTLGEENAVLALQRGAVDYVMKDRPARLIPAMQRALSLRREQRLRLEAEQRLREQAGLLDKARDAVCVTDLDGRITYRNQAATRLLGWNVHRANDRLLHELFKHTGPEKLSEALQHLHGSGTWHGEIRVTGLDGNLRNIESRWTLVHDDAGRPKSILLINTDVTEQKKLEAQLLRAQRMESIGTLAGGIAHDLNNALSPILMSCSLLRSSLQTAATQDESVLTLVGVLQTSAQHGSDLIKQLLAFARGAEGDLTELQPQSVIKDVVTLLGDTLPRAISIETNLLPSLWPVRANSTQLVQVILNLGINARDAMPKGGRLVIGAENLIIDDATAAANPGAQPGPHVRITVSDTGTGIPPDLIDRIFDPFFTTKAAGKGLGLGLSSVVGIIKGHGGFLQVQSEVGHGTEFRLYLPAAPSAATAGALPAVTNPAHGNGETVLLIDDEGSVRDLCRMVLIAYGYKVYDAPNGLDGLILYRKHQHEVQAVVTDMMMPGLQGTEVISELQRINPDIRIVAMSGIASELAALRRDPKRLTILPKPMTAEDLVRAVQLVMSGPRVPS